jgi:hypothetical protein
MNLYYVLLYEYSSAPYRSVTYLCVKLKLNLINFPENSSLYKHLTLLIKYNS